MERSLRIPAHVPLAVTTRGGRVEGVHYGSIAVVDVDGKLVAGIGDPDSLNFTRSSLKPLQAYPFVQDGGIARFGFTTRELALMCASHSGEPMHVEVVSRILERIGAAPSDLQCGCHPPMFYSATGKAPPEGGQWSPLQHNCSGKHSGFLAYCRLHGLPLGNYLDPEAPLQQRIREAVHGLLCPADMAMGIDGCSAPNYALPLTSLALAFCRLGQGGTPELDAIGNAMRAHPELVSGTSRFDLALMTTGAGDWVSKSGAQGMQAIGIRSRGLGIAVRLADGNPGALRTATVAVLQALGVLERIDGTPLAPLVPGPIRNYRGTTVGDVRAAFKLPVQGAA
jgi:L-asparaginase II